MFFKILKYPLAVLFLIIQSSCLTLNISDGHYHEFAEPQGSYYVIQKGDTLSKIAKKFKIHENAILDYNNISDPSFLAPGFKIYIASKKDFSNFKGVISASVKKKEKKKKIKSKNQKKKRLSPSKVKGKFVWPSSGILTSKFGIRWGRRHDGIDIGGPVGQEIRSTAKGEVLHVEYGHKGYGNLIIIKHSQDFVSIYAHCSKIFVKKGNKVARGKRIALVGKTGRVTGPHLHFELRVKNRPVDPLRFLPKR